MKSKKHILLVDDDKQSASALAWILADEGFLIDVAHDGEEAIVKVRAKEYDAVVCDVMMPHLRGDEFYLLARAEQPVIAERFIFITGFAANPEVQMFFGRYELTHLVKPFPIQALCNCLDQLFA